MFKKAYMLVVYKHLEGRKVDLKPSLIAALITLSVISPARVSIASTAVVDEKLLIANLRAAKVVPADSKLTASISGDEIIVNAAKKSNASDDACKITAVLIAKTVFDSFKGEVQRTKVILTDKQTNRFDEVSVNRAEVKMFGSGQLNQKELLASLEIRKGSAKHPGYSNNQVREKLNGFLFGAHNARLYDFSIEDVPVRGKRGAKDIWWYLSVIHESNLKGEDVSAEIKALNGAVGSLKVDDMSQYKMNIDVLRKKFGISQTMQFDN